MNLKRFHSLQNFLYHLGVSPEGLRKSAKKLSYDSRCSGLEWNREPLTARPTRSECLILRLSVGGGGTESCGAQCRKAGSPSHGQCVHCTEGTSLRLAASSGTTCTVWPDGMSLAPRRNAFEARLSRNII
jgi:hypothetical protein